VSSAEPPRHAGPDPVDAAIATAFRTERAAVLATLIRHVGDFQLAEDAVQDAFADAVSGWRRDGVPARPGGWLMVAARRRAIDRMRRNQSVADRADRMAELMRLDRQAHPDPDEDSAISALLFARSRVGRLRSNEGRCTYAKRSLAAGTTSIRHVIATGDEHSCRRGRPAWSSCRQCDSEPSRCGPSKAITHAGRFRGISCGCLAAKKRRGIRKSSRALVAPGRSA
jgi:Sigma-70 region 2